MNPSDDRKAAAGMHMGMCVFAVLFSIFWCVMAVRVGAGFMVIFGVLFVGLSLWRLALCVKMLRREKGEVGPEKPCASPGIPGIENRSLPALRTAVSAPTAVRKPAKASAIAPIAAGAWNRK